MATGAGALSGTTPANPITPVDVNPQPTPSGTITPATMAVTSTAAGSIAPGFVGLSYEKGDLAEPLFTGANTDLMALFTRLGPSVLRIGGSSADYNSWVPDGPGFTTNQTSPPDVDRLAAFVKSVGWQCLYTVSLLGVVQGTTTPALAAAEVAYVAAKLGPSLIGIEIGNEPDLYPRNASYFPGGWSFAQYKILWEQFRAAILAVTPTVPLTGPATANAEATWTVPFGEYATSSQITLLTQHYYRANGRLPTSTAAALILPDPTLVSNLAILQAGAQVIGVPFRISECNSYYEGGAAGVSDAYASSLWIIDFLFNCAQGGAIGVNLHGGGNLPTYTPIADNAGVEITARPEYYGAFLFTLAGSGTLFETQVSAGSLNVTGYAVSAASGGLNLVIVNKDLTQNLQLTATLPSAFSTASLILMTQLTPGGTGPDLSAITGVTMQGGGLDPSDAFSLSSAYSLTIAGDQITFYVPALSAVLIKLV
jgi:hypothetical protein